jgi:hypothetical protein
MCLHEKLRQCKKKSGLKGEKKKKKNLRPAAGTMKGQSLAISHQISQPLNSLQFPRDRNIAEE